jgi:segregation and condensation protein B
MQEIKNKIEAVLFITGRFMSIEEIAQFSNIASIGPVKQAIKILLEEYSKNKGALEIIQEDGKYKLNIRKAYIALSSNLISAAELDRGTQATLAIIAYKQPAIQSEIVKMRGSSAYDHIKILRELDFITSEKKGRTRILKLAPKFYDYFDVAEESLKEKFKGLAEKKEETKKEIQKEEIQEEIIPKQKKKEQKIEDLVSTQQEDKEVISRNVVINLDADDFGS